MTNEHPITPPPELVQEWVAEIWHEGTPVRFSLSDDHIATRAAQWGADQELEACRQWLEINGARREFIDGLRAARRPKPQSLKEQALEQLDRILKNPLPPFRSNTDTIRRALEALPDD